jgi:antitoxin component YwqK of YwqJK toxin-antitoxin module
MAALVFLASCQRPADLDKARIAVDSAQTTQRADSIAKMAITDSLRDGHHTYRDAQGRLYMEGDFLNKQRQGVWTSYGENGRVMSRNEYSAGKLEGLTTVFQENGALKYSGDNNDGHPVGEWRFFDATGGLAKTVVFDSTGRQVR